MAEQITIKIPDSDEPGFIEERIAVAEWRESVNGASDVVFWNSFADFAVRYIVEPRDEEKKKQNAKRLSRAQVKQILDYLNGKFEDTQVPLSKSPSSTTG